MPAAGGAAQTGRPRSCDCGECKKCKRANYMREWYRKKSPEERREHVARRDADLVRARDRARYEKDKEKRLGLLAARKKKHRMATKALNNAVQSGRIIRPDTCSECGAIGVKITGHHEDYDRPLEVVWLCYSCHGRRHRKADHEFVGWGAEGRSKWQARGS